MRDVFAMAARWLEERHRFALVTLVEMRGAKTAPLGTTIAVGADGQVVGNIGAACHEAHIVRSAQATAADGELRFIDVDLGDDALGAPVCAAAMRLVVWRPTPEFFEDALAIAQGERPVCIAVGGCHQIVAPKPRLTIVGATSLAANLCTLAKAADFHSTVVDPRTAFATRARLPDADVIVQAWPDDVLPGMLDAQSAVAILSHDEKLDLPALRCALGSDAWYVGLLGSRATQRQRREALRVQGIDDECLARIHGPIGLDLGGTTPAEIAVAIVAEMVALCNGKSAAPLRELTGSIH